MVIGTLHDLAISAVGLIALVTRGKESSSPRMVGREDKKAAPNSLLIEWGLLYRSPGDGGQHKLLTACETAEFFVAIIWRR